VIGAGRHTVGVGRQVATGNDLYSRLAPEPERGLLPAAERGCVQPQEKAASGRGDAEDPWLQENLWLARRSLGSQRLGVSGLAAFMAERSDHFFAAAVAAAWLSLLAAAWPRVPRGAWAATLGVAMLLWLGAWLMARHAPRQAVLLEECATAAGELPAGTELWLWPSDEESSLAVAGVADARCLEETVGWIEPGA